MPAEKETQPGKNIGKKKIIYVATKIHFYFLLSL